MKISRKTLLATFTATSAGAMVLLSQGATAQSTYDITAQCSAVRQSTYNSVKASIEAQKASCTNTAPGALAACQAAIDAIAEQQATAAATSAEEQCLYSAYSGR